MSTTRFPTTRNEQIKYILSDLEQLHPRSDVEKYAIEQNTLFFKSIRSIFSYSRWLYGTRKYIRKEDLLEINELLPSLDEVFHAKMAEIERRPRPGIISPVVDCIVTLVRKESQGKRLRIASLGSGSMEAERQAIEQLQRMGNTRPLTIVGFDISPNTRAFAVKNLSLLTGVRIIQETQLTKERLVALEQETKEPILVVVSDNDIFTLTSSFPAHVFDLVMTVLFLHHLDKANRTKLIEQMRVLAPQTLNYDGYQNEIVIPILSMTGWHSPVFLNAAIFSTVRFSNRSEVLHLHPSARIEFYNHGHYRAIFST